MTKFDPSAYGLTPVAPQTTAPVVDDNVSDTPAAPVIPAATAPSSAPAAFDPSKYGLRPVASQTPEPESLVQRSGRRAGQELLAIPAVAPALYGLGGALIDKFVEGEDWESSFMSDEGIALMEAVDAGDLEAIASVMNDPAQVLRTGLHAAADIYNWAGDKVGVTNNEDGSVPLDEEVGGIIGSTLLTLPASILSKPTALINRISNRTTRTALRIALKAAEMSTPMTIGAGRYGGNIVANAAIQVGINDIARELTGQQAVNDYIMGSRTELQETPSGEPTTRDSNEIAGAAVTGAAAFGAVLGGSRVLNRIANRATRGAGDITPPPGAADDVGDAATGPRLGQLPVDDTSTLSSIADVARRGEAQVLNAEDSLIQGMERTVGRMDAEAFENVMRSSTNAASRVAFERYINTGVLEYDGSIRTTAPKPFLAELNAANPALRDRFNMTMSALGEQQRRSRGIPPNESMGTDAALMYTTRGNLRDPQIQKWVAQHDDIMRGFTELRKAGGMIDNAQYRREVARRFDPNAPDAGAYVPAIEKAAKRTLFQSKVIDPLTRQETPRNSIGVSRFEQRADRGIQGPLEDPSSVLSRYVGEQMSEVNNMRVKRQWLSAVADQTVTGSTKNIKIATRNSSEGIPSGATKFTIMSNGKPQDFWVGDPRMARQLEFQPLTTMPVASDLRRLFQMGTTGNLNPAFAPVSLAYDAFFGALGGNAARLVTGRFDQFLKEAGLGVTGRNFLAGVTRPVDTLMLVGEGFKDGAMGRMRQEAARSLAATAQATGKRIDNVAAEKAAQLFIDSKYGLMHMRGYSSNSLTDNLTEMEGTAFTDFIDKATDNKVVRYYQHFLDNLKDSYRMGLFSRNVAHEQFLKRVEAERIAARTGRPVTSADVDLSNAALQRITKEVRDVAVDPTKRGSNGMVNLMTSATPYANIILQSTAHLAKVMATNRGSQMMGVSMIGMAMMQRMSLTDEEKDYIDNRIPSYRQISHLNFVIPEFARADDDKAFNPDNHLFSMPMGPELGTIVNGGRMVLEGMMAAEVASSQDLTTGDRMRSALGDLVSFPVPPAINVALAAGGYGQLQPGAMLDNRAPTRQATDAGGGIMEFRGIGQNDGYWTDWMHNATIAALGTFGRTVSESAEIMDHTLADPSVSVMEGIGNAAVDAVMFNMGSRQQVGTLFTSQVIARPRGTPLSSKGYELDAALTIAGDMARGLIPNFSEGALDADIPYSKAITLMPDVIQDPVLRKQAILVKEYFGTPLHSQQLDEIGQLRKSYFRTQSNVKMSKSAVNTVLNEINERIHENFESVLGSYGGFEQNMRQMFNDPEWTVQSFVEAASEDAQR